ncbi:MAG: MFS transporter [Sciscionella sp.]
MTPNDAKASGRQSISGKPSRRAAFRLVGIMLLLMLFSSAVPSPMYVIYQQRWHFSPTMLTLIFGVYALVVLASLWLFGSLSDTLGRRPVLIVSLLLGILSLVLFIVAAGVGWLFAARTVQGISVGLATGAMSAALIDLAPERSPGRAALVNGVAPMAGMGAGALVSGLLVQYVPAPTVVTYLVPLVAFAALIIGVAVIPEPMAHASGKLSLRPRRVSVPASSRKPFALLSLAMICAWSVSGLYLSLVPSLIAHVMHVPSHVVAGLTITVLTGAAALSQLAISRVPARRISATGLTATLAGLVLAYASVDAESVGLFFLGTAVLGIGIGATFLGIIRLLTAIAEPERRSELFAALYVVNYLALSVPAIIAGVLTDAVGLHLMTTIYLAFVGVVCLAALAGMPWLSARPSMSRNTLVGGTIDA